MDPLFKEIPRKERKVVVDERFKTMFTDDRFKLGKFKWISADEKNPDKMEGSSSEDGVISDEEEDEKNGIEVNWIWLVVKAISSGDDKDDAKTKEMIRAYQLERLRYYYAVCECDSEETAIAIYEGCDGAEYETSGVRFDLRFVPEEMKFDESRLREKVTTEDVNVGKYNPKRFESLALSNCNAKLTWDETNPERTVRVTEAFKEDCNLDGFDNLLAPPSDSDSEDDNCQRLEILLRDDTDDCKIAAKGEKQLRVEWDSVCSSEANTQEDGSKRKQKRKERKAQIVEAKKQSKEQVQIDDEPIKKRRKLPHYKSTDCMDMGDDRFSSLFTDSAFAIDKTHPLFKGGTLANQQVDEKRKRSAKNSDKTIPTSKDAEGLLIRSSAGKVDPEQPEIESVEALVQKLKKKTRKQNVKT
uniref:NUC153 domain-containing protein n=1 Tax=Ditylenchus dipsaci TaxID=166011 RepID=A0A915CUL1_9BILA